MARARLTQTDYAEFRRHLRDCSSRGSVLRPSDGERWRQYVEANQINEFAALAIARGRVESPMPVVLQSGSECDGYYIYSEEAEACFRLVPME